LSEGFACGKVKTRIVKKPDKPGRNPVIFSDFWQALLKVSPASQKITTFNHHFLFQ